MVAILYRHEFIERVFAVAVHAADKSAAAFGIEDLFHLTAVADDVFHDFYVLTLVWCEGHCCQLFRPPYAAKLREYITVQTYHLVEVGRANDAGVDLHGYLV